MSTFIPQVYERDLIYMPPGIYRLDGPIDLALLLAGAAPWMKEAAGETAAQKPETPA